MFAVMRDYYSCGDFDELRTLAEDELLPALRALPGFQRFMLFETDEGHIISMSLFATAKQAEAADWKESEIVFDRLREVLPQHAQTLISAMVIDSER